MSVRHARCANEMRQTIHVVALRPEPEMLYLPLMSFKP
jgi:hypothetical protein